MYKLNYTFMAFFFSFLTMLFGCSDNENGIIQPSAINSEDPVDGVRIAWDYSTLRKLSPSPSGYSGYARMIKLDNGNLYCVYENEGKVQGIQSADNGATWSNPINIAVAENGINASVPEILQLADKSILVSYNTRPTGSPDSSKRFGIRIKKSSNGVDWSEATRVYEAGHEFHNGCWEPAQIQLPSGEIQLFIANEGPYTSSNEQEITMFRSDDNGSSWSTGEKLSFRAGHRDGMPVPLILEDQNEIIFSIEDNGISPTEFKPVIIRTSLSNSWGNAPVTGESSDREQPFDKFNLIPGYKYAGAPYIRKLKSGEVILSYQGNEFRSDNIWDRSDMIVSIGDAEGRAFNRKTKPFHFTDPTKKCLWNSLSVIDENTVIALGSTNAYGNNVEVWMIKGHVLPAVEAPKLSVVVDGEKDDDLWNASRQIFIGGFGPTSLEMKCAWDESKLYVVADVKDANVFEGTNTETHDGFRIFLDPTNRATVAADNGIFSLDVTASGHISFREGNSAKWETKSIEGIEVKTKRNQSGYQVEMAIPWNTLGGLPNTGKRIGFHTCLFETSTGTKHDYEEPLSGNINNAPYTWSPMFLKQ